MVAPAEEHKDAWLKAKWWQKLVAVATVSLLAVLVFGIALCGLGAMLGLVVRVFRLVAGV